jgi:methylmalonyl-CoA decarboxylase subunit alpha
LNWSEKIEELKIRRGEALEMGGPDKILRQREQGKLTARERLDLLFDRGSFIEYGMLAMSPSERLKKENKKTPADAVIVGYGKINGRPASTIQNKIKRGNIYDR